LVERVVVVMVKVEVKEEVVVAGEANLLQRTMARHMTVPGKVDRAVSVMNAIS
jgi:hypothetical protein